MVQVAHHQQEDITQDNQALQVLPVRRGHLANQVQKADITPDNPDLQELQADQV